MIYDILQYIIEKIPDPPSDMPLPANVLFNPIVRSNDKDMLFAKTGSQGQSKIDEEIEDDSPMVQIRDVFTSGPTIKDKKSIFQAHVARIENTSELGELLDLLKSKSKIGKASHNIVAYRTPERDGYSDDGE